MHHNKGRFTNKVGELTWVQVVGTSIVTEWNCRNLPTEVVILCSSARNIPAQDVHGD